MNAETYLDERVDGQIEWLDKASGKNQCRFKILRTAEIIMGCTIAYLVGHAEMMTIQVVTGAMGVAVAAIGGLLSLYRFQEKWVEYRVAAEMLKREKYFFLSGTKPYDKDDKFHTLVSRVEGILAAENMQWAEATADKPENAGDGEAGAPDPGPPKAL